MNSDFNGSFLDIAFRFARARDSWSFDRVGRMAVLERALTFTGPRFVRATLPENAWLTPGTHYRCEIDAAEPFFVDLEYVAGDPLGPAWLVSPEPRKIQELFGQNRRPLSDENALTLEVTVRRERPC